MCSPVFHSDSGAPTMSLWVTVFMLGSFTLSLVECGCSSYIPRKEYDALCIKWWDEGLEYSYDDDGRMNCLKLIEEKCPHIIEIKISPKVTRKYESGRYEKWEWEVMANLRSNPTTRMVYYDVQKKPVCWDDNGKVSDCNHWWKVAQIEGAENKDKELCINRILSHCKNMISKVSETSICKVKRCRRGYDIRTVIYKQTERDTASYNRYVPIKE